MAAPIVSLTTERLLLRTLAPADAPRLFAYRRDPEVARYQNFAPGTEEEARAFIALHTRHFDREGTWHQLGIFLPGAQELIGDAGLHFLGPENAQAEIGYTIAPRHQRRGYGAEAVTRLVDFVFRDLRKHRLIASLDPANLPSVKLLERVGFRREGLFRQSVLVNGRWADDLVYAVLREEWGRG